MSTSRNIVCGKIYSGWRSNGMTQPSTATRARLLFLATAIGLTLTASGRAHAARDSIELQLPASAVLDLIADRARASIDCFPPIPFGMVDILVDHIAFPAPPTLRRSPMQQPVAINASTSFNGHPVQIVVPVKLFTKLETQLVDPTRAQDQYLMAPETSAIFDLSVRTNADGVNELCATMNTLEPAIPFQNDVVAMVRQQLGDACFPLNLDGLDDILDGQVGVVSRGISADVALTRLAVRLDFAPTPNLTRWQTFVNDGAITNTLATSDFALTFDKTLLARVLRQRFEANLDDPQLEVERPGLQTLWMPFMPLLNVFFNAQLDVVGCANTIGAHPVNVAMSFGLAPDKTGVVMNGQMSWDLVDSDVFLCGFTWAVFLGHYGLALDPVAMGVLGGLSNAFGPDGDQLPPECSMGNNNNFTCKFPLVLPTLQAGGGSHRSAALDPDGLYVTADDLVIAGDVNLTGYKAVAPLSTIGGGQINYGITGGCSNLSAGYYGSVTASGRGGLCRAMVIEDDPLNIFGIKHLNEIHGAPFDNDILIKGANLETYAANPYAAKVVIHTAGGGRGLPLGPLSIPSEAEKREVEFEYVFLKANCMAKQTGLFGIPGKFDPRWKVDPPHDLVARVTGDLAAARRGARVTLENVKFEAVGRQTRPAIGGFAFGDQSVRVTATALIDFGAAGRAKVPVSTTVRGTLRGRELGRTGIVSASFADSVRAEFSVASTALPRGVTQISFGIDLSPRSVGLQGVLTPQ